MDFLLPFLTADFMGKPAWVWLTFVGIVIALLAFDLGVLHKDDKEIGVRESLLLSAGYISVALLFGAWVWWYLGAQSGMDYYTGCPGSSRAPRKARRRSPLRRICSPHQRL